MDYLKSFDVSLVVDGDVKTFSAGRDVQLKLIGNGVYELGLSKGEQVLLYTGTAPPESTVTPLTDQ